MKTYALFLFTGILLLLSSPSPAQAPESPPFPILDPGGHIGRLAELLVTPNSSQIITLGEEGTIRFLNPENGKTEKIWVLGDGTGAELSIRAGSLSPDGTLLAIGGHIGPNKNEIWLVEMATQKILHKLSGHGGGVRALRFSKDGLLLASGGMDQYLRLWSIPDGRAAHTLDAGGKIYRLDISSKGTLVTVGYDKNLMLWKPKGNTYEGHEFFRSPDYIVSAAFSPDGATIASAGDDGKISLWDEKGELLQVLYKVKTGFLLGAPGAKGSTGALAFSPSGRYLAFGEDYFSLKGMTLQLHFTARVMDLHTGQVISQVEHDNRILHTIFQTETALISGSGGHNQIFLWGVSDEQIFQRWQSGGYPISALGVKGEMECAFATQDKPGQPDKLTGVFDFNRLALATAPDHFNAYPRLIKTFKGQQLSYQDDHTLHVTGGKTIRVDPMVEGRIQEASFTPDGEVITVCDYALIRWDKQGQPAQVYTGFTGELRALSVSASGRYIYAGGSDQMVRAWSLESGALLASLFLREDDEWACWSPSGYYEASPKGHELLNWYQKQGENTLPALANSASVRERFHQPGLLRRFILTGTADTTEAASGEPLPPTILANIREGLTAVRRNLELNATIESLTPLTSISLELNDSIIELPTNLSTNTMRFPIRATLSLKPGKNTIRIVAGNESGRETAREWAILYQASPSLALSAGHSNSITDMAFSQDGKYLASASLDKTIKIWDINTGKLFQTIRGEQTGSYSFAGLENVAVNPRNWQEVASSSSNTILLFDALSGQLLRTLAEVGKIELAYIRKVLFDPTGQQLLSGATDGTIKVWDKHSGQVVRSLTGHRGEVTELAFGPQGKRLISIGTDNQLIVWDFETGALIRRLALSNRVTQEDFIGADDFLEFSPDGKMMLTGGRHSNQVQLWSFPEGKLLSTIAGAPQNLLTGAAFLAEDKQIALSSIDQPIQLYNFQGELLGEWPGASRNVSCLLLSPDGKNLLSAHGIEQSVIRSWATSAGTLELEMGSGVSPQMAVSISSSGQWVASGSGDGFLKLWNLAGGRAVHHLPAAEGCTFPAGIFDVAFSPDGSLVAAASCDHSIYLWEARAGFQKLRLEGHRAAVRTLAFSRDGRYLFSGSSDGRTGVWELPSGKLIRWLDAQQGAIGKIEASPDGEVLASADYKRLLLWDWRTGELLREYDMQLASFMEVALGEHPQKDYTPSAKMEELFISFGYDCTFAPDGKSVLISGSANGEIIRLGVEQHTREVFKESSFPLDWYTELAIDPGRLYLAAAGLNSRRIDLFYLSNGQPYKSLEGHREAITSIAFTPDGHFLLSASKDGSLIFWNLDNGTAEFTLIAGRDGAYTIRAADNYFLSSRGKTQELAFRLEDNLFLFEQFDLQLNRPDIILERLGFAAPQRIEAVKNAYLKRLEKMGFQLEKMKLDFTDIPEVRLLEAPPSRSQSRNLKINLEAISNNQPLDRLNVYINDVPIYGVAGRSLRGENRHRYETTLSLELSKGRNKIQVSALNQAGAESLRETFYVTYEGPERPFKLYLVALGAGEFADSVMNLAYPAKDVQDIVNLFRNATATYDEILIEDFYNQDITPTLLRQLKDKLMQSQVDDHVILYIAGHGLVDDNLNYYLATYDTDFSRPAEKAISYAELENLLDGIPARQKLFLMDACHSGEIDKESAALIREKHTADGTVQFRSFDTRIVSTHLGLDNSFELMKELFVDLRRGTGATVISSAGGVEFAMEGEEWKNGVFTYCLLKGLREGAADMDGNGQVMVSELQRYLAEKVPELTGGRQQPTFRMENISNDWRVW